MSILTTHGALKQSYILPILLGIFVVLATVGMFYNYPLTTTIGDETVLMASSLKMMAEPSLRPDYPTNYHMPAGAYLYLPFFAGLLLFLRLSGLFGSVALLVQFGTLEYGRLLPFARFISVALGVACLYLLYKICRKLFDDAPVALTAVFLLATDAWFVFLSHFGKVWIPQMFTILLALYCIVRFYRAPTVRLRDYVLIGLLTSVAFATHVVGVLVYLPFLVAQYYRHKGKNLLETFVLHKHFWVCNITFVLGVALTYYLNPFGFQNYFNQSADAALGTAGRTADPDANFLQGSFFYAGVLFEYAPLLIFLSLIGAYRLFKKNREVFYLLSSFVVGYYLVIGPFLGSMRAQPHYIAPVVPFLAGIAAYGLVSLWRERLTMRAKSVKIVLVLAFTLVSLYLPVMFDYRLMQETTQQQFLRWLYTTVPAGTKILDFDAYLTINENRASIELTKRLNPSFLQKRQEYLLGLPDGAFPSPNYFVFQPLYPNGVPAEIDRHQFAYAVLTWHTEDDYKNILEEAKEFGVTPEKLFALFPANATEGTYSADIENLRKPISNLLRMKHTGPIVAVYKLQ